MLHKTIRRSNKEIMVSFVINTIRSFPHLWHHCLYNKSNTTDTAVCPSGALPVFRGVDVTQSFVFCVVFCRSLSVRFLLANALTVRLRCVVSDYPFAIFKSFRNQYLIHIIICFIFNVSLLLLIIHKTLLLLPPPHHHTPLFQWCRLMLYMQLWIAE